MNVEASCTVEVMAGFVNYKLKDLIHNDQREEVLPIIGDIFRTSNLHFDQ